MGHLHSWVTSKLIYPINNVILAMALILNRLYHGYFYIFNDLSDPRSADWTFNSVFSMVAISLGYLYVIKVVGPKLMENRPPFKLKNTMIIYNVVQILLNMYITYRAARHIFKNIFGCQNLYWTNDPEALDQQFIAQAYFYMKLLDLVDTAFFMLRKSYRQVTFLHLYHHFGMTVVSWVAARFFPGGMTIWIYFLNAFVHVVMFIYYFLTALDSSWKQSTTFKKRLTQLQLLQFCIILIVIFSIIFGDCEYPKIAGILLLPQNFFITVLFADFYLRTYVLKKKTPKPE